MTAVGSRNIVLAALFVTALVLLPRVFTLDRFVTADEHAWLARSGNFYRALSQGDFAATFQRHHPGVTTTWAGLAGFLVKYPGYAEDAPAYYGYLTEEIEPFLRSQGVDPVDVLAAGRLFVALAVSLSLLAAFLLAVRVLGMWSALLGFTLIALAPFHIAHSRLLHLDGLVSSFMFLSVVAFLVSLIERRWAFLLISALAAGMAWLTRSPSLYLVPYVGLVSVAAWVLWRKQPADNTNFGRIVGSLAVWVVVGGTVFTLLWPAMWVAPLGSLRQVVEAAGEYASAGHLKPTFFDGDVIAGDPGFRFYPITWLWRTTPAVLLGLVLAATGFVSRARPFEHRGVRFFAGALVAYAVGYLLFMSLGAKKFDRYLLPIYPALALVAGMGYAAAGQWLTNFLRSSMARFVMPGLFAVLLIGQGMMSLPTYPYYLSYYNPLMGGSQRAPEVMMIGWGEGGDQAAAYLNGAADGADVTVASGYTNGPFSYFFNRRTVPLYFRHMADYAVVYAQDWQRQLPSRRATAYYAENEPLNVVEIDGLEYAHIYALGSMPEPDFVTEWGEAIQLVSYQLPAATISAGESIRAIFYFAIVAPIESNLNVLVRVVDADGRELARSEGWPWGSATSDWKQGEVWPDGHELTIPADAATGWARVEVGFYDPHTLELLEAVQTNSAEPIGDLVAIDYVHIGDTENPNQPLQPTAELGEYFRFSGVDWRYADGNAAKSERLVARPGDTVRADLYWESLQGTKVDYSTFLHMVGEDGAVAAQSDRQPLNGFMPTSTWLPGQKVRDEVVLDLPSGMEPGEYAVYVGMYDLATMARLPVTLDGVDSGDAVHVTTLTVQDDK